MDAVLALILFLSMLQHITSPKPITVQLRPQLARPNSNPMSVLVSQMGPSRNDGDRAPKVGTQARVYDTRPKAQVRISQHTQVPILEISLGTPPQKIPVLLDTGSPDSYIPSSPYNCTQEQKFNESLSTSYHAWSQQDEYSFASGTVKGHYATDLVSLTDRDGRGDGKEIIVEYKFLLVKQCQNFKDQGFARLLGMSPSRKSKSIFDVAYRKGQLVSPNYAFKLGRTLQGKHSYFYYNITHEDFSQAIYEQVESQQFWTVSILGMYVDGRRLEVPSNVVFDTGWSQLLVIHIDAFRPIFESYFSKSCQLKASKQSQHQNSTQAQQQPQEQELVYPSTTTYYKCLCSRSQLAQYPIFTVEGQNTHFIITPEMYITNLDLYPQQQQQEEKQKERKDFCYLRIQGWDFQNFQYQSLLGSVFMTQYILVMDKQKKKLGFIRTTKSQKNGTETEANREYFGVGIEILFILLAGVSVLVSIAQIGSIIVSYRGQDLRKSLQLQQTVEVELK